MQDRYATLQITLMDIKVKLFSNKKKVPQILSPIKTLTGMPIEYVETYKYFGIEINNKLSFKLHVENQGFQA